MEGLLTFLIIIGIFFVVIGCIFLTRRKFIYSKFYCLLLIISIVIIPQAISAPYPITCIYIAVIFALIPLSYYLMKDQYVIINVEAGIVEKAITSILEAEGISFKVNGNSIMIDDYCKSIPYTCSLNSVDINFRNIRRLPFYRKIKEAFIYRIKSVEITVFPSIAVLSIGLGLVLIIMMIIIKIK